MSNDALLWTLVLMLPAAYLLGSVPFGVIVGRRRGVDVRAAGSGNIGATNVGRLLGKRYFFLVLLLDVLKAAVPTAAAALLVHLNTEPHQRTPLLFGLWLGVGIAAFLGHMFSPYLGFRGGKGVACGLGVLMGFFPFLTLPGVVAVAVFLAVYRVSGYISAGSIAGATVLPLAYVGMGMWLDWGPLQRQWPITAACVAMGVLIVWKHRGNISRLLAGTEPRNR